MSRPISITREPRTNSTSGRAAQHGQEVVDGARAASTGRRRGSPTSGAPSARPASMPARTASPLPRRGGCVTDGHVGRAPPPASARGPRASRRCSRRPRARGATPGVRRRRSSRNASGVEAGGLVVAGHDQGEFGQAVIATSGPAHMAARDARRGRIASMPERRPGAPGCARRRSRRATVRQEPFPQPALDVERERHLGPAGRRTRTRSDRRAPRRARRCAPATRR